MPRKSFVTLAKEYEYSMGNGQCPVCGGTKPNVNWWTDTIGHEKSCVLAWLIKKSNIPVLYETENPDRVIGSYVSKSGIVTTVRLSGPTSEKRKLKEEGKK
jgi:hypothetical protein